MEEIRVQNLRCLLDSGYVPIRPISLLVGANSSGKSTFLRVFQLLKQSDQANTVSGLLLNEGDVNFGFFNDVVHKDANPSELKLEFGLTLRPGFIQGVYANRFLLEPLSVKCEITYRKRSKDNRYPYIWMVKIQMGAEADPDLIEIEANEEGEILAFSVNECKNESQEFFLKRKGRGLIPTILRKIEVGRNDPFADEDISITSFFDKQLIYETSYLFHGRTTNQKRLAALTSVAIGSRGKMLKAMKALEGVSFWNQSVSGWTVSTDSFLRIRNILIGRSVGELLRSINFYISTISRYIYYYKPVRAGVERDYQSRDVHVDNVDSAGLNVAMVLASLSNNELRKFRLWMQQKFGFEVYPHPVSDGARISLRMKEHSNGPEFNLADMGFGFSQMLPFLVQIWMLVERGNSGRSRRKPTWQNSLLEEYAVPLSYLIAIEQPELHLHPGFQAKVAELFVGIVNISKQNNFPIRFVLETHSPTIIERIGYLVENGSIAPSDVQVLLFERGTDAESANTAKVRFSCFDEYGVLKDWPFGFLSAPIPNEYS